MSWLRGWGSLLGGGASVFTGLTDTPSAYSGQTLKAVRVNAGETALEFYTASAGAGNDSTLKNTLIVSDRTPVTGKVYATITLALAYIATLTGGDAPSASNVWTIIVTDNNGDNFAMVDYVNINGLNNAILSGQITSAQTGLTAFIDNCEVTDARGTAGKYLIFRRCIINGVLANTSAIFVGQYCTIQGANFTNAAAVAFTYSYFNSVFAITFTGVSNTSFYSCELTDGGNTMTMAAATYNHCKLGAGITVNNVNSVFNNCNVDFTFSAITSAVIEFYNSSIEFAITLNGGSLSLHNTHSSSTITLTSGTMDNRNSSWSGSQSGATANRPALADIGQQFFDTTLGYAIWFDNNGTTGWCDYQGTAV